MLTFYQKINPLNKHFDTKNAKNKIKTLLLNVYFSIKMNIHAF